MIKKSDIFIILKFVSYYYPVIKLSAYPLVFNESAFIEKLPDVDIYSLDIFCESYSFPESFQA